MRSPDILIIGRAIAIGALALWAGTLAARPHIEKGPETINMADLGDLPESWFHNTQPSPEVLIARSYHPAGPNIIFVRKTPNLPMELAPKSAFRKWMIAEEHKKDR